MIVSIGSDLCNIDRIQASLDRFGERFLNRVFTATERAKAARRPFTAAGTLAKRFAAKNGIEPHAGHGLTFDNVAPIAAIPQLAELNIGHFLIGEAIFTGLETSVARMRSLMDAARD